MKRIIVGIALLGMVSFGFAQGGNHSACLSAKITGNHLVDIGTTETYTHDYT